MGAALGLREGLLDEWREEESASIVGWDWSHLDGRISEDPTPWNYEGIARDLLIESKSVLDMGTGGGELLSSFGSLPPRVAATEIDKSFAAVARKRLVPLGVEVVECDHDRGTPFEDGEFDLVLNRHSSLPVDEIFRVLSPGGVFFSQQVDPQVEGDIREAFGLPPSPIVNNLADVKHSLFKSGFIMVREEEFEGIQRFKDVGALVYLLSIISCIIEDFTVDRYLPYLE